jgi:hypothetical protein
MELAENQRTFIKERSALTPLDEATAIKSAEIDVTDGLGFVGSNLLRELHNCDYEV